MRNKKFTIVANVFALPLEQVMLKACKLNAPFRRFSLISGLTATEKVIVIDETDGSAEPALFEGESLLETSSLYDVEDFDMTLSPNGWLVFDTSRTKIRECLFQLYKLIPNQKKFYRPTFIDHSPSLRVGLYHDIIDIATATVTYPPSLKIGHTIDGGGGGSFYYDVIPVPTKKSTWEILTILKDSDEYRDKLVCVISRHGYYYNIVNDGSDIAIRPSDGPIIDFLHLDCDAIIMDISESPLNGVRDSVCPSAQLGYEQFIYYITWKLSCQTLIEYRRLSKQLYVSALKDRQVSGFISVPKK